MAVYARCSIFRNILSPGFNFNFYSLDKRKLSYAVYRRYRNSYRTVQCLQQFHTTPYNFKRRKTAEERKAPRIIEYTRAKGEILDVWRNITPKELAEIYNKDLNYIYDIFLNQINSPNIQISDLKVLQQAMQRSGHRMRIIAKPRDVSEETSDLDAHPRPAPTKSELRPRPPVVTVMGHVDHGKTTLLDALRDSHVVDGEFGGITQHIGAFSVTLKSGARITFLDTPGHAAFSAMRARGANLTDIVVLVVAADDGVMEQTVESVRMARHANVPILVAINKIDSPKANVESTKRMLMEIGIQVEEFGGDVQAIPVSALKKQNLDQLTEALLVQAELSELAGDPSGPVEAVVVESKVDPHRGRLCTLVVQRGTLEKGAILVAGTAMAKVRVLRDERGEPMEKAPPGYPAEVEGWKDLPAAGEPVLEVKSERRAKEVIRYREAKREREKMERDSEVIEEKRQQHYSEYRERLEMKRKLGRFKLKPEGPRKPEISRDDSGPPQLNIILKTDVDGTLEAILDVLSTYHSTECKMDLVHFGVGAVTPNDIELATTFDSVIYAFNVETTPDVRRQCEGSRIKIKHHNVIYKLIDDVKEEINERLPPKEVEETLGEATVQQQFDVTIGRKKVPVAGCRCDSGVLRKGALFKVIRNKEVIYTGPLASMRHLKNEVDAIKSGTDCGLQFADSSISFEKDDTIICFEKQSKKQLTDWNPPGF